MQLLQGGRQTQMASECDYDYVNEHTPDNVEPAYDNLVVEW